MFLILLLVVQSCLVTIEAKNDQYKDYTYMKWKKDVWSLYEKSKWHNVDLGIMIEKIKRMNEFEHTPELIPNYHEMSKSKRPALRLYFYLGSSREIVGATTFLRKYKSTSENLLDFLSNHQGCNQDEISKFDRISQIYGKNLHLGTLLGSLKGNILRRCSNLYLKLMLNTTKLMGKENLDTIVSLSHYVDWVSSIDNSSLVKRDQPASKIEKEAKGIALYLGTLNNSKFNSINSSDSMAILKEIYEAEVQYRSSLFCTLLNPIRQNLIRLSSTHSPPTDKLIEFSCNLASIASSDMFWKLLETYTAGLFKVKPKENKDKDLGQVSPNVYTFDTWTQDVNLQFAKHLPRPQISETSSELSRMIQFENTPEFRVGLNNIDHDTGRKIEIYLSASSDIALKTSLLRYSKTTSNNLFDFISNHNGCSHEEISKIATVGEIFEHNTRISIILHMIKQETRSYCLDIYQKLLIRMMNLVGKISYNAVVKLYNLIDWEPADNYSSNLYDEASIELVSKQIASHLYSLEHPSLDDIESMNQSELGLIIGEIYEVEVQYPVSTLCTLLSPIRQSMYHMSSSSTPQEKLIHFSCDLASFTAASYKTKILQHFLDIRLDDILMSLG